MKSSDDRRRELFRRDRLAPTKRFFGSMMLTGVIATALTVGACSTNELGRLEASKLGDLSHGPAPREPYDAAVREACGEGWVSQEGDRALRRWPYVQRVAHASATVMWTGSEGAVVEMYPASDPTASVEVAPVRDEASSSPDPQWTAQVDGLEPGAVHCYRIVDGEEILADGLGFRTAPLPADDGVVRFVTMGDLGLRSVDQLAVRDQLGTVPFDFALINGDVAYEDGTLQQFEDNYFGVYRELLLHAPFFVASGNHDYNTADAAAYRSVFESFDNGGAAGKDRWQSFDWGSLHVVMLDTEKIGPEQAAWLDADLTENELPWVVVVGHRPAYSSGEHGSDAGMQQTFVPLFEKHHVPLVLAGHDHDYERTHELNGVTYIVAGAGGRGTRDVGTSSFTAFSEAVSHFVYVEIDGDTLTAHAIDATGQDFDSVAIERP